MADGPRSLPTAAHASPSPSSASWLASAKAHAVKLYDSPQTVVVAGRGAWLFAANGRKLLDFAGGMGVSVLGHGNQAVQAAIHAQVDSLLHTSNALLSPAPIELAAKLFALSCGYQSFFVNSGAEAMEGALKLARMVAYSRGERRPRFVACTQGFHGRTLGALSVTGQPKLQAGFLPLLPEVTFVPFGDISALKAALSPDVAAFVVEPILGNGGVRLPPAGYLTAALAACRAVGALLIADEVQTGIGRTGAWFASHAEGVRPDVLCLAKALGGGLPLGAVLALPTTMQAFAVGSHGSTFGGNPVACRAGLATIEEIERHGLLARATQVAHRLMPALGRLPHVAQVRGRGLLLGLELTAGRAAATVRKAAFANDLLVTLAGPSVVRLFLPACVTDGELDEGVRRLKAALSQATAG